MTRKTATVTKKPPRRTPRAGSVPEAGHGPEKPPTPTGALFERYGLPTAVLDVHETAAYLAVTSGTVYRLVRSGELAHVRIGRSVRFRVVELNRYLEDRTSREWSPHGHETRDNRE